MEVETEVKTNETPNNVTQENSTEENSPSPQPQDVPKKIKKDEKSRKDEKNIDQFMKSLNSSSSTDEKLSLACKRYVQTADDNKKLQFYIKQSDKRYALLLKEKDQLQHEYNKTVLVKSKLENLCRELQKQNKSIKEESLLKIREEEERRKETQTKFQNTLSEITTLLQQNNEKNAKLRDDNISMTEKFKSVVQQYQLREQQVDKMAKQMALESQLSEAKLQKASLEHQAEKERLMAEMEQLKVTLAQYRAKIYEMQSAETALKGQLAVYTDKYDEFQNALVKSNQVFGGFKEQIDKMSKKIQTLEKESASWKRRWETSQASLLEVCAERQAGDRRLRALQGLCRTLQTERTALVATLKEHNIERPPLPTPPPSTASDDKVDMMAANCAQLKQSLAHLQNQLNVLTKNKEETAKPEKQKKSKSKKNKEKAQKEKSEEPTESNVSEPQPIVDENKIESTIDITDDGEDKIDSKTMESLIQAINMANINLCDLEVKEDAELENGVLEIKEIQETQLDEPKELNENTTADAVVVVNEVKNATLSNIEDSNELKNLSSAELLPEVETTVLNKEQNSTSEEIIPKVEATLLDEVKDSTSEGVLQEIEVSNEVNLVNNEESTNKVLNIEEPLVSAES